MKHGDFDRVIPTQTRLSILMTSVFSVPLCLNAVKHRGTENTETAGVFHNDIFDEHEMEDSI